MTVIGTSTLTIICKRRKLETENSARNPTTFTSKFEAPRLSKRPNLQKSRRRLLSGRGRCLQRRQAPRSRLHLLLRWLDVSGGKFTASSDILRILSITSHAAGNSFRVVKGPGWGRLCTRAEDRSRTGATNDSAIPGDIFGHGSRYCQPDLHGRLVDLEANDKEHYPPLGRYIKHELANGDNGVVPFESSAATAWKPLGA